MVYAFEFNFAYYTTKFCFASRKVLLTFFKNAYFVFDINANLKTNSTCKKFFKHKSSLLTFSTQLNKSVIFNQVIRHTGVDSSGRHQVQQLRDTQAGQTRGVRSVPPQV